MPPVGAPQPVKLSGNGQGVYVPDKYGMHEISLDIGDDKYVLYINYSMFCQTLFNI